MTTWSDDDIQEKLHELVDLGPEELEEMTPPTARPQVEEYLDLHRRLKEIEELVPLPADFAVRVAEESGVLRPAESLLEKWLAGTAIVLSSVVCIVAVTMCWAAYGDLIVSSEIATGLRGEILAVVAACCGAFTASLMLDRRLGRFH